MLTLNHFFSSASLCEYIVWYAFEMITLSWIYVRHTHSTAVTKIQQASEKNEFLAKDWYTDTPGMECSSVAITAVVALRASKSQKIDKNEDKSDINASSWDGSGDGKYFEWQQLECTFGLCVCYVYHVNKGNTSL